MLWVKTSVQSCNFLTTSYNFVYRYKFFLPVSLKYPYRDLVILQSFSCNDVTIHPKTAVIIIDQMAKQMSYYIYIMV